MHWISDAQLIVETDTLDYTLTTILSIVNEENKVHLVVLHSCTFTMAELNYHIHDKKLLIIFKAFKIWWHYLESLAYPINIVIDYKYFSTTKVFVRIVNNGLYFIFLFLFYFYFYFIFIAPFI